MDCKYSIFAISFTALLHGCASNVASVNDSEARRIALSMGLNVPDMTPSEHHLLVEQLGPESNLTASNATGAAIGAATGVGLLLVQPGPVNFPDPEESNHLAAWVPESLANTQAEAAELLRKMYLQAAARANGIDFKSLVKTEAKFEAVFATDRYVAYSYPNCPTVKKGTLSAPDMTCGGIAQVFIEDEAKARWSGNLSDDLSKRGPEQNPAFIGPGQSYLLFVSIAPFTGILQQKDPDEKAVLAQLPNWVYKYVAPSRTAPAHILHRNEVLQFIEKTNQ